MGTRWASKGHSVDCSLVLFIFMERLHQRVYHAHIIVIIIPASHSFDFFLKQTDPIFFFIFLCTSNTHRTYSSTTATSACETLFLAKKFSSELHIYIQVYSLSGPVRVLIVQHYLCMYGKQARRRRYNNSRSSSSHSERCTGTFVQRHEVKPTNLL